MKNSSTVIICKPITLFAINSNLEFRWWCSTFESLHCGIILKTDFEKKTPTRR